MAQQVRITAILRKELDVDRLAAALVDLVIQLRAEQEKDSVAAPKEEERA